MKAKAYIWYDEWAQLFSSLFLCFIYKITKTIRAAILKAISNLIVKFCFENGFVLFFKWAIPGLFFLYFLKIDGNGLLR